MPSALTVGARSLSFSLTGSGGVTFGVWRMRSERTNMGWEIGVQGAWTSADQEYDDGRAGEQSRTNLSISVGPSFRRYIEIARPVVPFVHTGVGVRYSYRRVDTVLPRDPTDPDPETVERGRSGGLFGSLGLGLEWFPVERFSVSAYTGVGLVAEYGRGDRPGSESSAWSVGLDTFTTGVLLRIYFVPGSPST
ncbi:MAG TPA: hypothetical protein VKY91_24510 [Vulgatibacteraceae bacterium]|jgi:hypothetical protein|nr:MAG: hypothetical protein DIU52_15080 [bacterium]HLV75962.1 hypothetical protein [Vulgatibacteraceae bacterium]